MTPISPTDPQRIREFHRIRDLFPGNAGPAQRQRLLMALQTMGAVTTFEASRFLDLFDPRARKMELVNAGHNIMMTWVRSETESGEAHRIGLYSLIRVRTSE